MCGIVGIFALNDESHVEEDIRKEISIALFTEILQMTEERGKDATGIAAMFESCDFMIQKMGIPSSEFIGRFGGTSEDYEGFMKLCREHNSNLKVLMGHCRKSSVGNTTDNVNNHPIKAGEIIGIHNGTLKNYNTIFDKLDCDRDGVVDSEAIFRLIQHFTNDCVEPFTVEMLEEVVRRLDGTFSCICVNANNPYQVALFRDGRPMEISVIKPLNLMIVASETRFIKTAIFNFNKFARLYNSGLDTLNDSDIISAALPNDYVAVVDLTQDASEASLVADLMQRKDTFRAQKLWKKDTTYTYYSNKTTTTKTTSTTTTKTSTNTTKTKSSTTTTSSTTTKTFNGKVFHASLKRYIHKKDIETASKVGAITIDTKGSVIQMEDSNNDTPPFEVDETNVKSTKTKEVKTTKKITVKKKKVDVSTEPDIIEAAKNAKEGMLKYESNADLANDIGASDPNSVNSLVAFALANRVRKHVFENAFIAGAKYYKSKVGSTEKFNNAQSMIRLAKCIIHILSLVLSNTEPKNIIKKNLELGIEVADYRELTPETMDKLFSAGDYKNNDVIDIMKQLLEEDAKNEQEADNSSIAMYG